VKGRYRVVCEVGGDGRLAAGRCDCAFYVRMSLQRGPCKHLIALHRKVMRAA
jgi:predicted nucleic acid-binding Zn finger protein